MHILRAMLQSALAVPLPRLTYGLQITSQTALLAGCPTTMEIV
jgi:hypothetical protein